MHVEEVEWVDSCRVFIEWTENPQDAMSDLDNYSVVVHSVGYLAREWHDRILLLRDNGHDQICGGIIIPKVSIQKRTRLEATSGLTDREQTQ